VANHTSDGGSSFTINKTISISPRSIRMDGWMGGWVDGWMGGWVDGLVVVVVVVVWIQAKTLDSRLHTTTSSVCGMLIVVKGK
jgi:beta-glucanase (GH16 family)